MKQINVGIIGTGWCGGIRAETCAMNPLVNDLHVVETRPERLAEITRRFDNALVISPFASLFTARIAASGRTARLTAIAPPADDDLRLAPASCDAIFDLLDLHAVNDVPGRLDQISRALRPDGLYLACFFGGETLMNFPLVKKVIEYARDRARAAGKYIDFSLTTNGTLLRPHIIEYLAERFPDKAIWPRDAKARAHARSAANEMHAGFQALRMACPMNLSKRFARKDHGPDVAAQRPDGEHRPRGAPLPLVQQFLVVRVRALGVLAHAA